MKKILFSTITLFATATTMSTYASSENAYNDIVDYCVQEDLSLSLGEKKENIDYALYDIKTEIYYLKQKIRHYYTKKISDHDMCGALMTTSAGIILGILGTFSPITINDKAAMKAFSCYMFAFTGCILLKNKISLYLSKKKIKELIPLKNKLQALRNSMDDKKSEQCHNNDQTKLDALQEKIDSLECWMTEEINFLNETAMIVEDHTEQISINTKNIDTLSEQYQNSENDNNQQYDAAITTSCFLSLESSEEINQSCIIN